jgi:hypothetical protein
MERGVLTRTYFSDGALTLSTKPIAEFSSKSEPALSTGKKHPLLEYANEGTPHGYFEYLIAAQIIENIVNDGSFIGSIRSRFKWHSDKKQMGKQMSDTVLKLVYGTIKCLPLLTKICLILTRY